MRDLFMLALLPAMLYAMAKRPFIALGMWIWTAMFFPNAWVYGPATSIRYNLLFSAITIVAYLVLKNKPKVTFGMTGGLVFLFFFWTSISSMLTVGNPDLVLEIWIRFFKVVLLFVFVVLIIDKKLHLDFFLGCVILSIGFYGALESAKFVLSGGHHQISGFVGHALGDRNELALAFVVTLPVCVYLLGQYGKRAKIIQLGLLGLMGLLVVTVIGTQSRGGFVALLGLAGYLFLKSDRKILLSVLTVLLVVGVSTLVSAEWTGRMNTIGQAGEDTSFMGRVVAWKLSFILAAENPFFGGGFKSLETASVWSLLCQDFFKYSFFYTGEAFPDPTAPRAAHSIYFQVMGEHGFVGLAIYLTMLLSAFRHAAAVAKRARAWVEAEWIVKLAVTIQLSLFAFCLGGAALSFAYFELIYAFCGFVVVLEYRILPRVIAQAKAARALASLSAPAVAGEAVKA